VAAAYTVAMFTPTEPEPGSPPEPRPRISLFRRGRDLAVRCWRAVAAFWRTIRPGPETRRGVAIGAVAGAAVWAIPYSLAVRTGLGTILDVLVVMVLAAAIIGLSALLVWLLLAAFRRLSPWATGFFVGSVAVYVASIGPEFGIMLGFTVVSVAAILGASIAALLYGLREAALAKKIVTIVLLVSSAAAAGWFLFFAASDGTTEALIKARAAQGSPPAVIRADNPGRPGPYRVRSLTYGSGGDKWRAEYRNVAIRTPAIDASAFFKDFKNWRAKARRLYWGFGFDKLPLNARVWYPDGPGPFPLVLIVHGNHQMEQWSDPGYQYLGELLASRGFILASVDENFLNFSWSGDPPKEKAPRGWMLLEHLRLWRDWNAKAGNPFFGKVDLDRIALMGHSRGGEAAATAALFNKLSYYPDDATIRFEPYDFHIRSIVAIAPADGQYRPAGAWRTIENVNYFVLQGGHDADVSSFIGSRQFERVKFTAPGPWFKSELYIYRANHGQFNTVWGRYDSGDGPIHWFLNTKPLLSPDDQRRIASVYISAFLETTLHNHREYLPLFRDARAGRDWLPDALCLNRYEDATWKQLAGFGEDVDVTTGSLPGVRIAAENFSTWKEGRIPFRNGDRERNGVFLGWNRKTEKPVPAPAYTISLPDGIAGGARAVLAIELSTTDDEPPVPKGAKERKEKSKKEASKDVEPVDFTVELTDAGGKTAALPLSRFGALQPPLKARLLKSAFLNEKAYKKASEPVLETIELPLRDFTASAPGFDPAKLKTIRLRFDRGEKGSIVIGGIGYREEEEYH